MTLFARIALSSAATLGLALAAAHAEEARPYTITIAPVAAHAGQPAKARVVFTAAAGYHINKEFPTSLKLTPPDGISVKKQQLAKGDAKLSEGEGSFEVELTAAAPGKKVVPGDLRFAVCSASNCNPQRAAVMLPVEVK
jgi:hypothetical protein